MGENGSCNIVDYRISKVVDKQSELTQSSSWVDDKFEISSDGMFKVKDFKSNYTIQKVYIEPKNSIMWSIKSSKNHLVEISFSAE